MDAITRTVEELVRQQLPGTTAVDLDTPLAGLGMNSLRAVSLLVALEKRFAVEFPPGMVTMATFHSVGTVVEAVRGVTAPDDDDAVA
jgi:acyl carrier protein